MPGPHGNGNAGGAAGQALGTTGNVLQALTALLVLALLLGGAPLPLAAGPVHAQGSSRDDPQEERGQDPEQDPEQDTEAEPAPGVDSTQAAQGLEIVWQRGVGRSISTPPVFLGEHLALATTDNKVHYLDLNTGKKVWARGFKDPIEGNLAWAEAVPPQGVLVVPLGGRKRSVRGLDAEKGKELWSKVLSSSVQQLQARGDRVWVLEKEGRLSCVGGVDGKELWSVEHPGWGPAGFLLDGESLYLLSRRDSLFALEAATGKQAWAATPGGLFAAPATRVGGALALVSNEGILSWIDPASGALLGRSQRKAPQISPPVDVDGMAVTVSAGGEVEAGRAGDPEPLWTHDTTRAVRVSAVAAGSLILVATTKGLLQTLRADRGSPVWSLQTRGGFLTPPLWRDSLLVLATNRGEVYVYRHSR